MKKKRKSRTHPPEQLVTCRKEHSCDACGTPIKAGEKARLQYTRQPEYNDSKDGDKQTGIYYGRWYFHIDADYCNRINNPEDYEKNNYR